MFNLNLSTLTLLFAISPVFSANAADFSSGEADICTDPVKAVCEGRQLEKPQGLGPRLANQAAYETEHFFREERMHSKDFISVIGTNLQRATNLSEIQNETRKILTYFSCFDFLARSYYNSNSDSDRLNISCFSDNEFFTSDAALNEHLKKLEDLRFEKVAQNLFLNLKGIAYKVVQDSHYDASEKATFLQAIAITNYSSMREFANYKMSLAATGTLISSQGLKNYSSQILDIILTCDPNGTQENAFNYPVSTPGKKGGTYYHNQMVICPSAWISATTFQPVYSDRPVVARDASYRRPMVNLNQIERHLGSAPEILAPVILHELGHSVDSFAVQLLFANLQKNHPSNSMPSSLEWLNAIQAQKTVNTLSSCISNRYIKTNVLTLNDVSSSDADDTNSTPKKDSSRVDPKNVKTFSKPTLQNGVNGSYDPLFQAFMYFNEYHADTIAANGMSIYLSNTLPKSYTLLEDIKLAAAHGLQIFCDQKDNDPVSARALAERGFMALHPSGAFRIENTFLGNKNLRKALKCSPAKINSCSFL